MLLNRTIKALLKQALKEDIAEGDITTRLSVPRQIKGKVRLMAKQKAIVCGLDVAREIFHQIDPEIKFRARKKDGDKVKPKDTVVDLSGRLSNILIAERVALNFLALLSAVATLTREFVKRTKGLKVKIRETRKTTPNLRDLEKYAVRIGGGGNHRRNLSAGILVKENHLRAASCIRRGKINQAKIKELITNLKKKAFLPVEIEVENLREFKAVIKYRPDIIMIDNFSLSQIKKAVAFRNQGFGAVKLEASGGINLDKVAAVAKAKVDFISVGMLTHSPAAIDFSLEVRDE